MARNEELQERQRRAGINESRFRSLNEVTHLEDDGVGFTEFICECAQQTCTAGIPLGPDEYEEVRSVATHFVVAPGHVITDIERVVRETERYQIVEKVEDAATVAISLDPRARSG